VLRSSKPDAVLVQGDTTTAFITSLAAFCTKMSVVTILESIHTGISVKSVSSVTGGVQVERFSWLS